LAPGKKADANQLSGKYQIRTYNLRKTKMLQVEFNENSNLPPGIRKHA
jgi:hypothetical protein